MSSDPVTSSGRTSEARSALPPTAIWAGPKDYWISASPINSRKKTIGRFEQWGAFSATWPTSGMTRNGSAYELPTWAPPTSDTGSSSSPTLPTLKTPTSQLAINGGSQHPDKRKAGGHGPTLADEVEHLLPTPTTRDWKDTGDFTPKPDKHKLPHEIRILLPTPQAGEATKASHKMGVERRAATGQVFLTNHLVDICGLDPTSESSSRPSDAGSE